MSQSAGASIVYTPTNLKITNNTFLDLNNDGIDDFEFNILCSSIAVSHAELTIGPAAAGNQIWGKTRRLPR